MSKMPEQWNSRKNMPGAVYSATTKKDIRQTQETDRFGDKLSLRSKLLWIAAIIVILAVFINISAPQFHL